MTKVKAVSGNVVIAFQAPRQRMRDILTTAFESGIAYWANEEEIDVRYDRDENGDENGYVRKLRFIADGNEKIVNHNVDDLVLARYFGKALTLDSQGNFVYPDAGHAAIRELAGFDADASTADVLVQFAVFEKVLFG